MKKVRTSHGDTGGGSTPGRGTASAKAPRQACVWKEQGGQHGWSQMRVVGDDVGELGEVQPV